jgi:elongation factor Ts
MDCKKALQETDGDIEEAFTFLQKKGSAASEKKASRTAAEGLVQTWLNDDQTEAVLVEVNCETDFVSQNDQFQDFVDKITETIGTSKASSIEELMDTQVVGTDKPVSEYTSLQVSTIGEKISTRRFVRYSVEEGLIGAYIHAGGQIGVLIQIDAPAGADRVELDEFARDVAMHIAAMNPAYLNESDIPEEDEAAQKEILVARAKESGKPDAIIERMVTGQLAKWRSETVLLSQPFVKDSDKTIGELTKEITGASIASFVRYEVGEGIETHAKSLSEEVAEQLRGDA